MSIINRQAATRANTTALRKDELGSIVRRPTLELETPLKPAEVGQTIPIVFCKRSGGVGGAWITPPLVRTGLQNLNENAIFNHAFLLSDGQITSPIADFETDILIGWYPFGGYPGLGEFITNREEEVTYGALPVTYNVYTYNVTQYFDFEINNYYTTPIAAGGNAYNHNIGLVSSETGTGTITITSSSPFCTSLGWNTTILGGDAFEVYYDQTSVSSGIVSRLSSSIATVTWDYSFADDTGVLSSGSTFVGHTQIRTASVLLTPLTVTLSAPEYNPVDFNDGAILTFGNFSVVDQQVFDISEIIRKPFIIPDPLNLSLVYRENTTGDFTGMTILGLRGYHEMIDKADPINAGLTDDLVDQINNLHNAQASIFCSNGINVYNLLTTTTGPSSNYADLVYHLGLEYAETISMDITFLTAAANFTSANSLFFNGALVDAVNYKEWIESTAGFFLLVPLNLESRIGLRPALPVTGAHAINTGVLTPAYTFDEDTITEGTYAVEYIPLSERKPFEAVMLWRDQADPGSGIDQPFTTSLKVRYAADTGTLPQEQYDMSDFCVTSAHATLAAKYFLAKRKRTTHTISFSTDIFTTLGLKPGDLIAVELDRVTSDGTSRTETNHYLIDTLTRRMDGTASITAEHFPLSSGASVIAADIVSGSFTVV
jgi:hypothetical protein